MDKFSKIQHKDKLPIEKEDYLYDGYLKLKEKDGYEYICENDCAISIVHLLDFNEILLRKEIIPPFNDKYPDKEFFLTVLSGTIEKGENPIQTITRELVEEAGILLNTTYMNYESWGKYFYNKSNASQCHIYYIPLRTNEFRKVEVSGDGSELEKRSSTVRVDIKYLEALKPSDLVTSYCLLKLKSKI